MWLIEYTWRIVSAFEFIPTLLVNKFSWSYHKVALDLWGSRIWLNVSIFYQFHKAKSRYLSSEPGHWFKKQLSKFSWNQSKDLTFAQIFAFCDLNVIFDNSNWIECVYILKFQIGVNSKAVCRTRYSIDDSIKNKPFRHTKYLFALKTNMIHKLEGFHNLSFASVLEKLV